MKASLVREPRSSLKTTELAHFNFTNGRISKEKLLFGAYKETFSNIIGKTFSNRKFIYIALFLVRIGNQNRA